MPKFHAVMIDETGCEFGASIEADSRDEAYDILEEDYPESRIDTLKSCAEWDEERREREARMYRGDYEYEY